jgi:hypothetical protein
MRNPIYLAGGLIGIAMLLAGCPRDTNAIDSSDDGGVSSGSGGRDNSAGSSGTSGGRPGNDAGRGGNTGNDNDAGSGGSNGGSSGRGGGNAGSSGDGNEAGKGESGTGGAAGGDECPPDLVLPAICRMCDDGSCGAAMCSGGSFSRWYCPEDDDNMSGELRWFETCGHPVCGSGDDPFDDPTTPNCTGQEAGEPCDDEGALCDGVLSCGASLLCTASDPTMRPGGCPRSRTRFKDEISYLDAQQRRDYHAQVMSLPLASYRYKHAEGAGPQLGFLIEDVEPSVAVSGDHVNMYGYLSMAVAAIQVQQAQITALQRELEQLRAQLPAEAFPACGP